MKLSDSIRRALRTGFHAVIALVTLVPALFALLPSGSPVAAKGGIIVAAVAAVSALINKLEDAGLIPAWLKADNAPVVDAPVSDGDSPVEDVPVADTAPEAPAAA